MTTNKSVLCNVAIIRVLPFLNNLKDLDPSDKTDLDLWHCFGRKKSILYPRKYGIFSMFITFSMLIYISNPVSKLLISPRKFSGTRKFAWRYQWFGMNFDSEILRVNF